MKVTEVPKVIGTDGVNKMGKSLNNHIEIAATPDETTQRVMSMVTDPQRMRRTDPGRPEICNVFSMHHTFSSPEEVGMVEVECRRAGIGCVDCKKMLARNMNAYFEPFRARRAAISESPSAVWDVLADGGRRAREIASQTMAEVRAAVGLPAIGG
jgi:tryptophanyl-tRNA synthetase